MVAVAEAVPSRSRTVVLAAVLDDAPALLAQQVAALRAWLVPTDLELLGVSDPADLPVGAADRALLSVHEQVLGRPLEHTVTCPGCGERTTLSLARADVGEHHPRSARTGPGSGVREPTCADVVAAHDDASALLRLCTVGSGGTLADLARVEGSLSGPLHSACAGCGLPLEVDVDVVALALGALGSVRADLDLEVHLLAARYGWDLAVIESLPDDRRRRLAGLAAGSAP